MLFHHNVVSDSRKPCGMFFGAGRPCVECGEPHRHARCACPLERMPCAVWAGRPSFPQSFAFRGFAAPASCAFGFVLGVRARSAATPLRGLTCATSRSGSGFAFALNRLTASPLARPPPIVVARTGVAALRSAHGLRPQHRPVAWAPFRPVGLIPMPAPPSPYGCPGGLPPEETAARRMRLLLRNSHILCAVATRPCKNLAWLPIWRCVLRTATDSQDIKGETVGLIASLPK